jgi:hypothetical protein
MILYSVATVAGEQTQRLSLSVLLAISVATASLTAKKKTLQ